MRESQKIRAKSAAREGTSYKISNRNMPESSSSHGVVISGGGRGIGRALARHFLNKGDRVYLLDVDADELHHTVHVHLGKHHPANLSSAICDLRNADEIRKTITDAAKFLGGRIDVLINNASTPSKSPHPSNPALATPQLTPQPARRQPQASRRRNGKTAKLCSTRRRWTSGAPTSTRT